MNVCVCCVPFPAPWSEIERKKDKYIAEFCGGLNFWLWPYLGALATAGRTQRSTVLGLGQIVWNGGLLDFLNHNIMQYKIKK